MSSRGLLRLTGGLAHTVNNSLTGTIGYLELALRRVPPGSEQFKELEQALACTYRAAEVLRQLVTFATAPSHVHMVPVSLAEVALEAARVAKARKPDNVSIVTTDNGAGRVLARLPLLAAAVAQIVQNALEAMPRGGRLTLETEESGGRCKLWVRDSGPGLPREIEEHLFEPFVSTKSFGHSGLGLTLANELVRAQSGTLTISSCPGAGTTVLFSFPAYRPAENDPGYSQGIVQPPHRYESKQAIEHDSDLAATAWRWRGVR
jgi:signal transduction histidine kinase